MPTTAAEYRKLEGTGPIEADQSLQPVIRTIGPADLSFGVLRCEPIIVGEPTQDRLCHHATRLVRWAPRSPPNTRTKVRNSTDSLVRPSRVVVADKFLGCSPKMSLGEEDKMVQTLPLQCPDDTLHMSRSVRSTVRDRDALDTHHVPQPDIESTSRLPTFPVAVLTKDTVASGLSDEMRRMNSMCFRGIRGRPTLPFDRYRQ